ncbi:hypothetical protein G4B88_023951 [Cannabis sativa]|uniref:Uncharacterized protein n=1 Tax=Cannabis sativa TaxID=3483 RepID=A0A7J6GKI5_CANSA|nr:hypothetical protein G4B88_023951 [Cannabis sativa]
MSLSVLPKIFTSQGIDVPTIEAVLDATPTILNAEARSDMSRPFTSEERQWDHTTLQSNFCQVDIDRICTIPLNLFPSDEILIWHHSSTSYQLASNLAAQTETSTSSSSANWWQLFGASNYPRNCTSSLGKSSMSIQDYLVHVSTKLSKDQLEQFKIILWCIWFERNAETHEKKAKTAALLLRFATSYLTDYKKANTNSITASHATQS